LSTLIRFINDILLSAPSIIIGCSSMRSWSCAWGISRRSPGAVALAVIAIPVTLAHHRGHAQLVPAA
jgi:ABC-type phosphate transport system permease subunit